MKRKTLKALIVILVLYLLFDINILITSTKAALEIFINKIFIFMFPFLILSNMLINIGIYKSKYISVLFSKLFNISNDSYLIIILSALSGYPSSAVYIKEFLDNKKINISEATKLLSISSFPNPMFVIGTVGISLLNNKFYGISMLVICYISSLIYGFIIRNKYKQNYYSFNLTISNESISSIIKKSILASINTLILILGNITLFIIILNVLFNIFNNNIFIKVLLSTIFEMTNSIIIINNSISNIVLKLSLICFSLNFSGLSIISQICSIITNYNINKKEVIKNRLIISLLSSVICAIYFTIIFSI